MGLNLHSEDIPTENHEKPLHFEMRNGVLCLWTAEESEFVLRLTHAQAKRLHAQLSDYLDLMPSEFRLI